MKRWILIIAMAFTAAGLVFYSDGISAFAQDLDGGIRATGPIKSTSRGVLPEARFELARFKWNTVVNNGFYIPKTKKRYNSYNQPSVNSNGTVVFRGRGKGHPRATGIYFKHGTSGNIQSFVDLETAVPYPNNLATNFNEFPSIPRIALNSSFFATRGNHQPVYMYNLPDGTETRAGTTGIYVRLDSDLILTGASKLGAVPGFEYYGLPESDPVVPFDVFPGSPSITDDATIVFKGNFTVNGTAKTGVFFRRLLNTPGGGYSPAEIIASSDTEIPDLPPNTGYMSLRFGSTAPPSAAGNNLVFLGLDNEQDPRYGGIYLAPIKARPQLQKLIGIGDTMKGTSIPPLTLIGEALAYDGRYVAFWAAWGSQTETLRLYCPTEGSRDRIAYCNGVDPNSIFDKEANQWYQEKQVPINQGVFVYDTQSEMTYEVATTSDFNDFVFWVYSGLVPGTHVEAEEGEAARWRSGSFLSVSNGQVVFKARTGALDKRGVYIDPMDGLYFADPLDGSGIRTIVETGMDGSVLDPTIPVGIRAILPITEVGIEREGFRGHHLAISAAMGTEETGWAGIYHTDLRDSGAPGVKLGELEE